MTEGALRIRPATADDIPLLQAAFAQFAGHDDIDEKVLRYRERLARLIDAPGHRILVAVSDDAILGYAAAQDYGPATEPQRSIARMHDLWVRPDARGRGAGKALFEAIREWAATETAIGFLQWQSSPVALDFYSRLGLTEEQSDGHHFALDVNLPASG